MEIQVQTFTVHKRVPLTISRGTTATTTNLWLQIRHEGLVGWGEASPFGVGDRRQTTAELQAQLELLAPVLAPFSPLEQQAIARCLDALHLASAVRAAVDVALQDWWGKRLGLPLWQLWGLDRDHIPPTSVTIGLGTPAAAQQRLQDWATLTPLRAIKVKLGSPTGIEVDQAILTAIRQVAPPEAILSVDANGGWSLGDAIAMCHWLADQGVVYVEQPLPRGQEAALPELHRQSPLPLFADESCFHSHDIPRLADRVDGINIKLMKAGGLTEALRMIHTARACGLKVMFGCYSDSTLANTALAHLSPLADYVDLDSHLNLLDDPFTGAVLDQGRLQPTAHPGLGVQHHAPQR